MPDDRIEAVAVVVPARDEASMIGQCLLAVAAARLPVVRVGVRVVVMVVADSCRDATADVARAGGAHVHVTLAGSVGGARRAGCAAALRILGGAPRRGVWLATTDADSTVPVEWLSSQLAAAWAGYDAVAGLVRLAAAGSTRSVRRWEERYAAARRAGWLHGRVHGANLGVRADAYRRVGGFDAVSVHEDVRLVRRLQAAGHPVAWPDRPMVSTSSRLAGRAEHGVAGDLRRLA